MRKHQQSALGVVVVAAVFVFGVLGVTLGLATGPLASASLTNGITVAGGNLEGSAANELFDPSGVAVDVAGDVYVADTNNNRVQKWDPGATSGITVAGGNGQGAAANQLSAPAGVFVDPNGDVYVGDNDNGRVQEWAPGATSGVTVAGGNGCCSGANQLGNASSVFVDTAGDIYVADGNRVQKWAKGATSGVTVAGGNGGGSAANQLDDAQGVFVDGAGNVYVADTLNDRVQEWAPGATSGVTVAGTGDGFGGAAANQLNFAGLPGQVYVNSAGDIYVADTGNNRVQEWAPGATSGQTVAGGNSAGAAANQVSTPTGLFVDGSGDIYVASLGEAEVQKWAPGPNGAPLTTVDPQSQSVLTSANVTFTAGAIAQPFPAIKWQESTDGGVTWSDIAGATSPDYSITGVPLSDNGDQFRAVFSNGAGSATTDPATLTVNTPAAPTITTQPVNESVTLNGGVSFTAAASGAPPPSVYWQESTDGGATWSGVSKYAGGLSNTITVGGTASDNGEEFQAVFTNSVGTTTTNVVTLTVTTPQLTTSVLLPSNGAATGGTQVLDASASGPVAITSVRFEINGAPTGPFIATGTPTLYGWLAEWDTTTSPYGYGNYTLQSVATDADGNIAVSAPITITVKNIPTTSLLVPSTAATQSGTAALVDASASAHVRSVTFEVSGGTLTDQPVATGTLTLYGWLATWNTTTVPNGTYLLQSVALYPGSTTDNSANSLAGTSVGVPITVNNPPPTTSVLLPSNGASVSGTSSLLDAGASLSAGVTSVTFELSGGTLNDQVVAAGTYSIWGWYTEWNTTTVSNGTYTLQSVATYPNGESGTSAPVTITVAN